MFTSKRPTTLWILNSLVMRAYLFFIGIFLSAALAWGQTDSLALHAQVEKKIDFQFETGTSVMSFQGMGSMGNYYFAPGLSIKPTPHLSFKVKAIFERPSFSAPTENMMGSPMLLDVQPTNNISLYAEGEYQFNEKLHICGHVYRGQNSYMNAFGNHNLGYNSVYNYFNRMQESYSIGVYYQLTKNLQVGAAFQKASYPSPSLFNWGY
jgi:hypothetical protein